MRCKAFWLIGAAATLWCADPAAAQDTAPGEATFRAVCAACHSIHPPAAQAPPMAHVARRYLASDTSRAAVRDRIVAWVLEPAPERSLMPPMAVTRWGLMPPLALPEAQLRAVAEYVLTLGPAGPAGGGRHGHRHGRS